MHEKTAEVDFSKVNDRRVETHRPGLKIGERVLAVGLDPGQTAMATVIDVLPTATVLELE